MKNKGEIINDVKLYHTIVFYLYLMFSCLVVASFALWYIHFFAPQIELSNTLRLFGFDGEKNIPTVFNVLLLLINSYIFYAIYAHEKKIKDSRANKWFLLSTLFLLMSFDDFFTLHESLVDPVKNYLNTSGVLYFAWVIPILFLVLAVLVYFYRFFTSLPKDIKTGIAIVAGLYLSGAIGMKMFNSWWLTNSGDGFWYKMITTVEESLKMIALIHLIKTLFLYENQDKTKEQLLPAKRLD